MTSQQGAVTGVITTDTAAGPYIAAADAMTRLSSEFGLTCSLANGHVLAAQPLIDELLPLTSKRGQNGKSRRIGLFKSEMDVFKGQSQREFGRIVVPGNA